MKISYEQFSQKFSCQKMEQVEVLVFEFVAKFKNSYLIGVIGKLHAQSQRFITSLHQGYAITKYDNDKIQVYILQGVLKRKSNIQQKYLVYT